MRTGTLVLTQRHRTRPWTRLLVDLGDCLYEVEIKPSGTSSILLVDQHGRARFEPCPVAGK